MKKRSCKIAVLLVNIAIVSACQQTIKNTKNSVEDEISADTLIHQIVEKPQANKNKIVHVENDILGYWVGDFVNAADNSYEKDIALDEGLYWNRDNKINISINRLENGKIYGHSVVAGNYRPFEGTYNDQDDTFSFEAREPGDDRYDGLFSFSIAKGDSLLTGDWQAYKKIDIPHRKYDLQKKTFIYNPDQMLQSAQRFANWDNFKKVHYENLDEEEKEIFGDFYLEFETATELIYSINASQRVLSKQEVENLKRGDLYIIRNTIYARHGYSFKNRPLRVFFDREPWYIPVHNDIKKDLTDIEKDNIKLLMKYEKNAKAYYDTFGRG